MNKTKEEGKEAKKDMKKPLIEGNKPKEEAKGAGKNKWMDGGSSKSYTIWDFMKFTIPFVWKGGVKIRI